MGGRQELKSKIPRNPCSIPCPAGQICRFWAESEEILTRRKKIPSEIRCRREFVLYENAAIFPMFFAHAPGLMQSAVEILDDLDGPRIRIPPSERDRLT